MRTIVSALVTLQAIDNEVRQVARVRDDLNAQIDHLHAIVAKMEAGLAEKRGRLADAERWYREKNDELLADQEKVRKAKGRLTGVTKPKEYQATIREIEALRKSNAQKEEEILKLLEAIEEFKRGIARDEEESEKVRAEVTALQQANAGRLEELDAQIAQVGERRTAVEENVPAAILKRYKLIASRRDGVAVVEAVDGQCLGCFRRVPPQMYNILLKGETLETCPTCSRFVFVPESVGLARSAQPPVEREDDGLDEAARDDED